MIIAAIQYDVVWADPEANLQRLSRMMDETEKADIYVLPEMFSTGFAVSPEGIAETCNTSLDWMREMARVKDAAICGSVAFRENGHYYNRFYFVTPDGTNESYDKRHLFSYGGEHLRYKAGKNRVVVMWKGVRMLLQTCYDLRFPVFSRNRNDYDLALYVASWPDRRHEVWTTLLRARAIENQCYVVGVNRVGDDPTCHYIGGSAIIDPYGRYLSQCTDEKEGVCMANVDIDVLKAFRSKFPVLDDADRFNIV